MLIVGFIFPNRPVKETLEIPTNGRVRILINGQAGGRMLDEDMEQADPELTQIREFPLNDRRNQMKTTRKGGEMKSMLENGHSR
ncbi:hypothetical protein GCM10028819_31700 [Spirosoma humi]